MDSELIHKFIGQIEKETVEQFQEVENLFCSRDFSLVKIGDWFSVKFSPTLGYLPIWKYNPMTRYSFQHKAWECKIGKARFLTSACPFFEFVCELRGYTLPGTIAADSVVVDAGPWNGISGMYFSAVAEKGKVIFFEPDKQSADFIDSDIDKNGFTNCELVRKALYSKSGEVGFKHKSGGESCIANATIADTVQAITLDDLVAEHAPSGVDFFKIDIEGAEVDIADDIARYISENPQSWAAIASYHEVGGVRASSLLEERFAAYPYLVFKTAYPYHETTFVANVKNEAVAQNIKKMTSFAVGWKAIDKDVARQGG
ncbi:methyltransferase, FkbM family [Maridesulfovibrio ferrireducens]|uniref:Methyltransferase, FkbM family n=1 Tax=Maridesulfovibrio ferrireducens TaxID=246191 RepID=A0A1G9FL00_9BACT|nr:FkbM family methyltransferase [Maridesulfovibrio ferrireducens]SDK88863.1 methyltransferase, FkbM family [Maridesulfovibrio ferrireducens]